jgi:glycosyltransferase involved in cell wall biosynthesis
MKICLIAPEVLTVPPKGYWGGTESVVWDLAVALSDMGHDVSLVARPGSKAPPKGLLFETFPDTPSNIGVNERHFEAYKDFVKNFDGVVHDHSLGKYARTIHPCVVQTPHFCQHPSAMAYSRMVAVSYAQAKWLNQNCPSLRNIPVVYHGLDTHRFIFNETKNDYYLFFGVMARYKGAEKALQLAKETGKPFVFAGRHGDMSGIVRDCSLPNVKFLGEVSNEARAELFANAKAYVFPTGAWGDADPSNWLEVFGLTILEALASGTPVIASNNGACPEVIEDGKVGFICNSYEEMKEVIEENYVESISPEICRRYVEEKFSAKRMASQYLDIYRRALAGEIW